MINTHNNTSQKKKNIRRVTSFISLISAIGESIKSEALFRAQAAGIKRPSQRPQ